MTIINLTTVIMTTMCLFGCKDKTEEPKYYMYNTPKYEIAIKDATVSLNEAYRLVAEYIGSNKQKYLLLAHEIMRNDDYIIVFGHQRINRKVAEHNVSGFWVNSKTGEVREIKTKERIKNLNLLVPQNHDHHTLFDFISLCTIYFDDNGGIIKMEKVRLM